MKSLIDLIWAPTCHLCDEKLTGDERYVCTQCRSKLPRTLYHRFWQNHTAPNSDLNPMEARFAGMVPFEHATAPFFYSRDTKIASLVQDFKYRRFQGLAREMGRLAATELQPTGFFSGAKAILPVPLHWLKRYRRGYNQCEELAKGVSDITGIPVRLNLKARRGHRTQTHLTREERLRNTAGVFRLYNPGEIDGKKIIIIDDICTTGSTLTSAAQVVLEAAPSARISLLTLACTY